MWEDDFFRKKLRFGDSGITRRINLEKLSLLTAFWSFKHMFRAHNIKEILNGKATCRLHREIAIAFSVLASLYEEDMSPVLLRSLHTYSLVWSLQQLKGSFYWLLSSATTGEQSGILLMTSPSVSLSPAVDANTQVYVVVTPPATFSPPRALYNEQTIAIGKGQLMRCCAILI